MPDDIKKWMKRLNRKGPFYLVKKPIYAHNDDCLISYTPQYRVWWWPFWINLMNWPLSRDQALEAIKRHRHKIKYRLKPEIVP